MGVMRKSGNELEDGRERERSMVEKGKERLTVLKYDSDGKTRQDEERRTRGRWKPRRRRRRWGDRPRDYIHTVIIIFSARLRDSRRSSRNFIFSTSGVRNSNPRNHNRNLKIITNAGAGVVSDPHSPACNCNSSSSSSLTPLKFQKQSPSTYSNLEVTRAYCGCMMHVIQN
jgi:hypothetical protein